MYLILVICQELGIQWWARQLRPLPWQSSWHWCHSIRLSLGLSHFLHGAVFQGDPASPQLALHSSLCLLHMVQAPQPGIYLFCPSCFHSPLSPSCYIPWQQRPASPTLVFLRYLIWCLGTSYLLGTVPGAHDVIRGPQKCYNFIWSQESVTIIQHGLFHLCTDTGVKYNFRIFFGGRENCMGSMKVTV